MFTIEELRSLVDRSTFATIALAALVGVVFVLSQATKKPTTVLKDGKPITPRKVPGLKGTLPILGDALEVIPNQVRYHEWLLSICKTTNFQPWKMKIPGQAPLHIFSSPEHFEDILVNQFDNFPKGEYQLEMLTTFFGKSLVGSDGERWYHHRKTAVNFFTARSLRAYMASSAKRNLEQVLAIIDRNVKDNKPVNLTHLMLDFTMQTFAETGLGVKLDWIGRDTPHPFSVAMDEASVQITHRFVTPVWFWKLERALGIGQEGKLAKNMAYVVSWIGDVVKESLATSVARKEQLKDAGDEGIKSMIDLFVEHSRDDAEGLRPHDIVDFIQVMIIAARDTTAIALTWFFYELSCHPDVEAAIHQELRSVYLDRAGKKDNYFTPEDARSLVYLEAALKETLRLHPSAPFMFKETAQDTVIGDDVFLRKGQLVGLSMYVASRNTNVWGEDAEEFKPERWIDAKTGELRAVSSTKFTTFSAGPRSCVGTTLAMMELRVVTANLLSRFSFQLTQPVDGKPIRHTLLAMKDELIVKPVPVNGASAA